MMTPTQHAEWLELRKTGIGGSEVAALLSDGIETKYACKRRLFLEKSGVPADEEFNDTAPVRLGRLFEAPICDIYAHQTGRRVEELPRQVHPDYPELGVSVDRIIYAPDREGPGILEAKAMLGRSFFETKRTGAIVDYLCQIQHGILVASAALDVNIQWGSFVVGRSDDPALVAFAVEWHLKMNPAYELNPGYLIHFDVERNNDICEAILREGPRFWATLKQPELAPERLEIDSPKCGRCRWVTGCQGFVLAGGEDKDDIPVAQELAPLAVEYLEREIIFDQAKESLAETVEICKLLMGERTAVRVPVGGKLKPLYYRQQDGQPAYAQAVKDMSVQFNQMREKLFQIEKTGDASLAKGSELIPVPSSYVKRGKPFRVFRPQYLGEKPKKED